MPPRGGDDVASTGVVFPIAESSRTAGRRLSSVQRISARSLLKVWRGNNSASSSRASPKQSLKRLLRDHSNQVPPAPVSSVLDSPTAPISVDDHSPHPTAEEMASLDHCSFHDVESPPEVTRQQPHQERTTAIRTPPRSKIPREVTVVLDTSSSSPASHLGVAANSSAEDIEMETRFLLDTAETEAREYKMQLKAVQEMLDVMAKELRRERNRVQDLIFQNKLLLDELQCISGKDQASLDTHEMMKQEMFFLKLCLILSGVFIMCGGRPSFLAILVLLWFAADIITG